MLIIGGNGVGLCVLLWYTHHGTQPFLLDKGVVIARWGRAARLHLPVLQPEGETVHPYAGTSPQSVDGEG